MPAESAYLSNQSGNALCYVSPARQQNAAM